MTRPFDVCQRQWQQRTLKEGCGRSSESRSNDCKRSEFFFLEFYEMAERQEMGSIGFALFLLLAGLVLLGQRLGWFPGEFDWLFPVILITWGASEIYQRLR